MCRFCKIHENTRIIAFGTSAWVWDLDLDINFQFKNKLKNFTLDKHLNFQNVFTKSIYLEKWKNDAPRRLIRHAFFRRYARAEVPTLSNTIFSREYQLFACWLKMSFWIRVEKFMLSVHLVLEICGLKVVVSFNFAPSAPHVKRRVKSCEPRAPAATTMPMNTTFIIRWVMFKCLCLM